MLCHVPAAGRKEPLQLLVLDKVPRDASTINKGALARGSRSNQQNKESRKTGKSTWNPSCIPAFHVELPGSASLCKPMGLFNRLIFTPIGEKSSVGARGHYHWPAPGIKLALLIFESSVGGI
jgi:hypothetical protein